MSVPVSSILERKGSEVFTVRPTTRVGDAVKVLSEHNVGAVVVSASGTDIAGILSERDVVRRLASDGSPVLNKPVSEIMTSAVVTCGRDKTSGELMELMTQRRIRHVPVVDDGELVGVVSIGDVVKSYVDDLEVAAEALSEYVTGSGY